MITYLFTFCLCTNHFLYFLLGPSTWLFQVRPPPFSDSISKTFYLVSILTNDLGNTVWSVFSLSLCFFLLFVLGDQIIFFGSLFFFWLCPFWFINLYLVRFYLLHALTGIWLHIYLNRTILIKIMYIPLRYLYNKHWEIAKGCPRMNSSKEL